jgi:2,3-bisphosphoglycerate-dependent phosphoglycerate mutase
VTRLSLLVRARSNNMAKLILVRHGKSTWNKEGLWTGQQDVDLTEEGYQEAERAGEALRDIDIDVAYVSGLKRVQETLNSVMRGMGVDAIETRVAPELLERSYGIFTGKNKWQVKEEIGEEEFHKIRRGWDTPIPEGESLKEVFDRAVPYYEESIRPELQAGKTVIISGHGNTLRALIKHLEGLDEQQVCELEFGTGEVYCYDCDDEGKITGKEIRGENPDKLRV